VIFFGFKSIDFRLFLSCFCFVQFSHCRTGSWSYKTPSFKRRFGGYWENNKPHCLCCSMFDCNFKACIVYNFCLTLVYGCFYQVIGPHRSGKSFLLNQLLSLSCYEGAFLLLLEYTLNMHFRDFSLFFLLYISIW